MRKVKTDDEALVQTWRAAGRCYTKTAEVTGLSPTIVRGRVMGRLDLEPRRYRPIGITGEEVHARWLALGGDRHAMGRLARRMNAKEDTLRAAMRKHLNSIGN